MEIFFSGGRRRIWDDACLVCVPYLRERTRGPIGCRTVDPDIFDRLRVVCG